MINRKGNDVSVCAECKLEPRQKNSSYGRECANRRRMKFYNENYKSPNGRTGRPKDPDSQRQRRIQRIREESL